MNRETLVKLLTSKKAMVAISSSMSLIAGAAIGATIATRRLNAAFDTRLEQEIETTKEHYNLLRKREDYSTPEKAAARLNIEDPELDEAIDALRTYNGQPPSTPAPRNNYRDIKSNSGKPEVITEVAFNVFTDARAVTDFDDGEIESRDPDKPYIISEEEFMASETDYPQTQLTYYSKDDTLTNEKDDILLGHEIEEMVGSRWSDRFGYGSNDPNIVYIRNNAIATDFEIVWSDGSFAKLVAGLDEEEEDDADTYLRHSSRPLRKFRPDRE